MNRNIYQQSNPTSISKIKFNRSKNIWKLNKVTDTNGIAKWGDLSSLVFTYSDSNKCPTKSELQSSVSSSWNLTISGTYDSNQCVKYSDISTSIKASGTLTINTGSQMYMSVALTNARTPNLTGNQFRYLSWRTGSATSWTAGLTINTNSGGTTTTVTPGSTIYIWGYNAIGGWSYNTSFVLKNGSQTVTMV